MVTENIANCQNFEALCNLFPNMMLSSKGGKIYFCFWQQKRCATLCRREWHLPTSNPPKISQPYSHVGESGVALTTRLYPALPRKTKRKWPFLKNSAFSSAPRKEIVHRLFHEQLMCWVPRRKKSSISHKFMPKSWKKINLRHRVWTISFNYSELA